VQVGKKVRNKFDESARKLSLQRFNIGNAGRVVASIEPIAIRQQQKS